MKVLISGGAGFIGSHVIEEFLKHHYEVVVVDNLTTGQLINVPEHIYLYHLDVNEPQMEEIFERERPDVVIHLAAQASVAMSMRNPYLDFFTNTAGTLQLLLLAKKYKVKKFLFASTAAVYGEPSYLPIDERHSMNPASYYAQSKKSAENYIALFASLNQMNFAILRFSNVYGPRQNPAGEAGVIAIFINQLLNDEQVSIYDGNQTRDFIYVKDVAKACRLAIESEQSGVFNISSGMETTIHDLFHLIREQVNVHTLPHYEMARQGEIARSVLANEKAFDQLGWQPYYSLFDGLTETIAAYTKKTLLSIE